jgi:hypothetical protein
MLMISKCIGKEGNGTQWSLHWNYYRVDEGEFVDAYWLWKCVLFDWLKNKCQGQTEW